jgi:hypothetical protein
MQEPIAPTPDRPVIAFARLSVAVDAWSSAIAGFALLAGARAFMFIALLGWREPVLGGAGLVLLALVGWLRWQCGTSIVSCDAAPAGRPLPHHADGPWSGAAPAGRPRGAEAPDVACYNRPSQCDACGPCNAVRGSGMRIIDSRSCGQTRTGP